MIKFYYIYTIEDYEEKFNETAQKLKEVQFRIFQVTSNNLQQIFLL